MNSMQKCRETFILLISGYSMIKGLPHNSGNELKTMADVKHIHTHKIKSDSFEVIEYKWVRTCLSTVLRLIHMLVIYEKKFCEE